MTWEFPGNNWNFITETQNMCKICVWVPTLMRKIDDPPTLRATHSLLFRDTNVVLNPPLPILVSPKWVWVSIMVRVSLSGESDYHNDPLMTTPASWHHCVVTRDHPRITDTAQANFRSDDDDEARATNPGIITLISASWRWINYRWYRPLLKTITGVKIKTTHSLDRPSFKAWFLLTAVLTYSEDNVIV